MTKKISKAIDVFLIQKYKNVYSNKDLALFIYISMRFNSGAHWTNCIYRFQIDIYILNFIHQCAVQ